MPLTQVCALIICASIGGLTALMALCGLTMFRASNRLSEFIAAIVLLYLIHRLSHAPFTRIGKLLVGGLLVALALTESLTFPIIDPTKYGAPQYADDVKLGHELDALCPGKSLYNIPPMWFPDDVRFPNLYPYVHLRPWLHTTNVSFSFGQATNRLSAFDDETTRQMIAGNVDLDRIKKAGYWGLCFVRPFFNDGLTNYLKTENPIALSPDFAIVKLK